MLAKMESLIMASVNARLLALEEQVSGLTHTVHMLRGKCKDTSSSSHRSSTRSHRRPSHLYTSDRTNPISHQNSHSANSLPFRVVWGTPRSCSSQVVLKAICALLPESTRPTVTVKGSFRRRGSRVLWWYTIMAPAAVMQQIVDAWHILEARTSWSLRPSLSGHLRPHVAVADSQCPPIPLDSVTTAADPTLTIVNPPPPVLSDVICPSVDSMSSGSTVTTAREVSREESREESRGAYSPPGEVSTVVNQVVPDTALPPTSTRQAAVDPVTRPSTPFLDQTTSPEEAS